MEGLRDALNPSTRGALHALNFFPYVAAGLVILQAHAVALRRRTA